MTQKIYFSFYKSPLCWVKQCQKEFISSDGKVSVMTYRKHAQVYAMTPSCNWRKTYWFFLQPILGNKWSMGKKVLELGVQGHRPPTLRSRVPGMSGRISLWYPVKTQDLRRIDSLSVGFYPIPWRGSIPEKLIIVEIRNKSPRLVWNPKALCCRLI